MADPAVTVLCGYFDAPGVRTGVRRAGCASCGAAIRVSRSSPPGRLVCFGCFPAFIPVIGPLPAQLDEMQAVLGFRPNGEALRRTVTTELARLVIQRARRESGRRWG